MWPVAGSTETKPACKMAFLCRMLSMGDKTVSTAPWWENTFMATGLVNTSRISSSVRASQVWPHPPFSPLHTWPSRPSSKVVGLM